MARRIVEQKDLFVSKIKITSPNSSGTGFTTSEYFVTSHDLASHFVKTDETLSNVVYTYDGDTDLWNIHTSGKTTTSDSIKTLLNTEFPSYMLSGNRYQIAVHGDVSKTNIFPIKIVLTYIENSTSKTKTINYPSQSDYDDSYSVLPRFRNIEFPDNCTNIKITLTVPEGTSINQDDPVTIAYSLVPIDTIENTELIYGESIQLTIDGGNGYKDTGTKSLVYSNQPVDGACSVSSSGAVTFVKPGKSWITVYNKGSNFNKTETDANGNTKTIQCTYQKSKLLMLEIEWVQRQVIIKVMKNITIRIGDRIPNINSEEYQKESNGYWKKFNVLSGDTLVTNPTLFFVYDSDDFYRLDVFQHTYSDDRYDNGIRYVKNDDGSWTVYGRKLSSESSEYNLIVSTSELPSYFKSGKKFKFTVKQRQSDGSYSDISNSPVFLFVQWYIAGSEETVDDTCAYAKTLTVPTNAVGVIMKLKVTSSINFGITGKTYLFNLIDMNDRSMDNLHANKYPVGARYAVAPNKIGYDQKIQYRSNNGKLIGLYVQNNKKYYIYLNYNEDLGKISVSTRSGYPYTEVTFIVESNLDSKYSNVESTMYPINYSDKKTEFDFLYDENTVVYRGDSQFFIEASYDYTDSEGVRHIGTDNVPFQIIGEQHTSKFDELNSGEYKFRIPISNCTINCVFHSLSFDPDDPSPEYTPEWITGNPPYVDIFGPKSGSAHYKVESKYWQAVVFCYFARQVYFDEDIPLMQGTSGTTFYNVNSFSGETIYNIYRKDLITVVNRISHAIRGRWPVQIDTQKNPDESFYSHAASMNAPQARLFTYAGYPRVAKYKQKWHWAERLVTLQVEIKYAMVTKESGAHIRKQPSNTATRVATYAQGTIVQYVGDQDGWAKLYRIEYDPNKKDSQGDPIPPTADDIVYTSTSSIQLISTFTDVKPYKTKQDVRVRTGPGTSYSALVSLSAGSSVLVSSVENNWAKLNAVYKSGTRIDYSKTSAYLGIQTIEPTTNQDELKKTIKEKIYEYDKFGNPVWSSEYDLDADGNIQYEDISYTKYNGKFPGVPTTDDKGQPDGGSTQRTIDWAVMNLGDTSKNPYGANDDYLINYGNMPNIGWGSYIGVMSGYNEQEFGATSYATYQEAVTVLWRYARFRQFDIMGDGGYYMQIDDSDVAYWAQHGPWRWAISRGIFDGYRMRSVVGGGNPDDLDPVPAKPTDYINRAEWAYMVYKFCTMYAW